MDTDRDMENEGTKHGKKIIQRVLKMMREMDFKEINRRVQGTDWVEELTRFEEVNVHPNDCWHEWWSRSTEPPSRLQQRSDDALQVYPWVKTIGLESS